MESQECVHVSLGGMLLQRTLSAKCLVLLPKQVHASDFTHEERERNDDGTGHNHHPIVLLLPLSTREIRGAHTPHPSAFFL